MSDFKFSQEYVLYKSKKEGVYPIKETDWYRIKRLIRGIIPNKNNFQTLSSTSFGFSASAIFSFIGFMTVEKLNKWIIPITFLLSTISLLAGIGFFFLDRFQNKMITYSTADVLTEMQEIEKLFDKPDEEQLDKFQL